MVNTYRALEAIYILEGYRVLLLQRPPHLYPTLQGNSRSVQHASLAKMLVSLSVPGYPTPSNHPNETVLISALAILSWPTIPRSDVSLQGESLWSSGFVELALSRWRHSMPAEIGDADALSLYFLTNVALNSDLRLVQRFARGVIDTEQRPPFPDHLLRILQGWARSDECRISLYHASALVDHAANFYHPLGTRDKGGVAVIPVPEMPHVPYGVFFSCLVLWCYRSLAVKPVDPMVASTIGKGLVLLQSSKVHISDVFFRIVRRLDTSGPMNT
jgi:hypothetical protein